MPLLMDIPKLLQPTKQQVYRAYENKNPIIGDLPLPVEVQKDVEKFKTLNPETVAPAKKEKTRLDFKNYAEKAKQFFSEQGIELSNPIGIAGMLGNFALESADFTKIQEQKPLKGRGGLGIAQATGSRRMELENFIRNKDPELANELLRAGLATESPMFKTDSKRLKSMTPLSKEYQDLLTKKLMDNSFEFHLTEMITKPEYRNLIPKLQQSRNLKDATLVFEKIFERADKFSKHLGSRLMRASQALKSIKD